MSMQNTDTTLIPSTQITALLATKKIQFEDGAIQHFHSDGTTDYLVAGHSSPGTWFIEGELYCSTWPPSTHVDRYHLHWLSANDKTAGIKFVHSVSGDVFAGTFI